MNSKKIAYSILELAVLPKGSSINQVYKNTVALAQKAEALGYERMWFAEHHNMPAITSSAPEILIGHVAQHTSTLRVGSGGVMLPNHSPFVVAEKFGTLGNLFPNRIDLGLGRAPGTDQQTARAINPGFIEATHSFPSDIEKIQNYFSTDNKTSKVRVTLAEGVDVPIYILGSSTSSARLAAQKGLPYAFASHFATAQLFNALEIYREQFQPSEALQEPYVIAGINVIIADTDEEAESLYTSALRMVINILSGTQSEFIEPPTEMSTGLQEVRQHPAIMQMTRYSFVGSKETVKKQVQGFIGETQVDELMVSSIMYSVEDRIKSAELFAEIMVEINESAEVRKASSVE
ncbi:LLM class flavin-dependent oxidoreductase [Flagellimonas halotolerans]|uniref:LLM class flavin-dependent oxidoreductase n=1 Tax=Flagellimonas halotolerans TaxID=3112164 RepID=A0ABU6IT16_9FLAO|nr:MULTISPECIES: LLM class flavin-dependent oxidoreductase [unclassified Allomuricauda]MEC3966415.1 LLM class flavin-dependent oxidoreductase [Muricauda sp. SYSU M86414]MEC4266280.1 LLM class flavin-dependent oxidoreductase [Muricauda sp. SYSU M84420]